MTETDIYRSRTPLFSLSFIKNIAGNVAADNVDRWVNGYVPNRTVQQTIPLTSFPPIMAVKKRQLSESEVNEGTSVPLTRPQIESKLDAILEKAENMEGWAGRRFSKYLYNFSVGYLKNYGIDTNREYLQ